VAELVVMSQEEAAELLEILRNDGSEGPLVNIRKLMDAFVATLKDGRSGDGRKALPNCPCELLPQHEIRGPWHRAAR